jgi:type III pantothenate kinase
MAAILAVTLGNSRAAAAVATRGILGQVRRVQVNRLEDLRDMLARARPRGRRQAIPVIVGSVNPPALKRLRGLAERMRLGAPEVARTDFAIPLKIAVARPERVGTDRLLGALAAHRRARGPCIIIDCGTATTVNAVSHDGTFLGGAILPGPELMARALARGTAQLPTVGLRQVKRVIGKSTEEAIRAGVARGWAGGVMALLAAALAEVGQGATVYLTGGGLAGVWPDVRKGLAGLGRSPRSRQPRIRCHAAPDLALEGLVLAYRHWRER